MWHVGDGMGWWMLWGGIMMVLFWGAIIALVVWAIQGVTRREPVHTEPHQTSPSARPPLEIAKERYARGDIGRDEFENIKKDLEDS
jgi:putative membrane protein